LFSTSAMGQSSYFLPNDDEVCPGESVTYTVTWGTGISAPVSYVFHVTGELQFVPNGNTVTVTWGSTGSGSIYADCYDALNNYVSTNTTNITINPTPNPLITSNSIVNCTVYPLNEHGDPIIVPNDCWKVCERSTVTYQVPLNSGSTYAFN